MLALQTPPSSSSDDATIFLHTHHIHSLPIIFDDDHQIQNWQLLCKCIPVVVTYIHLSRFPLSLSLYSFHDGFNGKTRCTLFWNRSRPSGFCSQQGREFVYARALSGFSGRHLCDWLDCGMANHGSYSRRIGRFVELMVSFLVDDTFFHLVLTYSVLSLSLRFKNIWKNTNETTGKALTTDERQCNVVTRLLR